jgi:succinoglycan biosynthesis protein ExoM
MRADAWPSSAQSESAEPIVAAGAPSVVVAVLTYRRPDDLAAVLPLLDAEAAGAEAAAGRASRVEVLVVDNDPDAGAREQVAALAAELAAGSGTGRVRYVHEPQAGIAAARNRALDEADGFDVLVFVDDDERPRAGWLGLLLATHAEHGGCGVVGPVVSDFEVPLDDWVVMGGFFDRRRLPTGTTTDVAATNNLLLDIAAVRRAGVRFDGRLGLSGGSDTLFTRRLVAAEGPLVWCDEAVVTDVVPAARATRSWVLRRHFRSGNSWSRTSLMLAGSPAARLALRLRYSLLGGARLAAGLVRSALGVVRRDLRDRAAGRKTAVRGLGMLLGAWGYGYVEYRRPVTGPREPTR